MGYKMVTIPHQPDDLSCAATALKASLKLIGINKPLPYLITLCKTNKNGVTVPNLLKAITSLGVSAVTVEHATLRHIKRVLSAKPNRPLAAMVSYLYQDEIPYEDTGHNSTIAAYSAAHHRIYVYDPYTASKISYPWADFLKRWRDYDFTRVKDKNGTYHLNKRWFRRFLITIAATPEGLPIFKSKYTIYYFPN